ncbi:MAG: bifunctional DNA-formamidopyrimidine glycosylase/DNA-(apurinic or apyrimidinic site) lyase [Microthrixaceae bacterium]
MPELPEVETVRRQLAPMLIGRTVGATWSFGTPKFDQAELAGGATFGELGRRGKYLLAALDGPDGELELVVHLGMTGRLGVRRGALDDGAADGDGGGSRHLRAAWELDDGTTFEFHDVRRFGRLAVVARGDHRGLPTLAALGPEPFDDAFTPASLRASVARSDRAMKTQLLSQRPVAGLGNIYADEALWDAGIHPRATRLGARRAEALHDAIRRVLAAGIRHGGTTLRDYRDATGAEGTNQHRLRCYGRSGSPCLRCGTPLRRIVVDARTTTFCPTCQTR